MSPDSALSPAARPLNDQARALVGFLLAHDHRLSEADASRICAKLPPDHKEAAKALRTELAGVGVAIKHTHALKAVAVARGSDSYLGLGAQSRYDVASWSPDAPGVGSERVRRTSLAQAADEMCRRLREQFEDDVPLVQLDCRRTHVGLRATSKLTGSWWHAVLVPVGEDGQETEFESCQPVERLAERLRRLVEGELGGWLDGMFDVGLAFSAEPSSSGPLGGRDESNLANLFGSFHEGTRPEELPRAVPLARNATWLPALSQQDWDQFLKRYEFFARRHEQALFAWARELQMAAAVPRFEPVELDQAVFERARAAAGLTWFDIGALFPDDTDGAVERDLRGGKACLGSLQTLATALKVEPNDLLVSRRATPRIPLPTHKDIALWLSRMEAQVSEPEDAPRAPAGLAERLGTLCAVPYEERRHWDKRPPRELEAINQEIRFAGLVVCAGMGVRFVRDLPLGMSRPASVSILEFDRQVDVLTQSGQLRQPTRSMEFEPQQDPVTPEWLARFNKPRFSANDLVRYSDLVHEYVKDDEDEKERFTSKVLAGVRLFKKDPEKAHTASVRMEALSDLIERFPMEPWVRRSRDSEDGALMISEAAFEAAARCELTDVEGQPGFDEKAFYSLCVEHARKYT